MSIIDQCFDATKDEPSRELILKWSVICNILELAATTIYLIPGSSMTKVTDELLSEMLAIEQFNNFWNQLSVKTKTRFAALYQAS